MSLVRGCTQIRRAPLSMASTMPSSMSWGSSIAPCPTTRPVWTPRSAAARKRALTAVVDFGGGRPRAGWRRTGRQSHMPCCALGRPSGRGTWSRISMSMMYSLVSNWIQPWVSVSVPAQFVGREHHGPLAVAHRIPAAVVWGSLAGDGEVDGAEIALGFLVGGAIGGASSPAPRVGRRRRVRSGPRGLGAEPAECRGARGRRFCSRPYQPSHWLCSASLTIPRPAGLGPSVDPRRRVAWCHGTSLKPPSRGGVLATDSHWSRVSLSGLRAGLRA